TTLFRSFNLQTSEKTILVTGFDLITEPKWNTEGWIAFNNSQDYRLRVVQENGDSLQIFFDKSFSFAVTWLPNNNLYWRYSYTQGVPYYMLAKSINTTEVDTTYNGAINKLESTVNGVVVALINVNGK